MDYSEEVDKFVKNRILPQYHAIVTMLRELFHEMAPNAQEGIYYNLPMYKGNKIFAFISPTKKDITLGFTHGVEFEDKYGLLKGTGKSGKHVKIKNLDSLNKDAIIYYLNQALELDRH